jgi:hypothetical protein
MTAMRIRRRDGCWRRFLLAAAALPRFAEIAGIRFIVSGPRFFGVCCVNSSIRAIRAIRSIRQIHERTGVAAHVDAAPAAYALLGCLPGLSGLGGLIVSKLFWLQIMRHKEFVEKAQKQQQHTFEVAPRRGVLYDRNLRELAMTVQADSIFAVPSEIDDKDKTVHALAQIVHTSP